MSQATVEKKGFTYADYLTWPDDERWEIIDGEALAMTPAPSPSHQSVIAEILTQIHTFLRGKPCRVFPAPIDLLLPAGDEPDEEVRTVVQPDIVVVCNPTHIGEKRLRGAPDLVIEVISPSTASRDAILKRRRYEQAGTREFWMVHPVDRMATVFRRGADGTFDKPVYYDDTGKIEVATIPGLVVDLSLVFPPVPRVERERPAPSHVRE